MKTVDRKLRRDQTGCLIQNWSLQEFQISIPSFGFVLPVAALPSAANIPHLIKLWQNKILRFLWNDTQFCSLYSYTQIGESMKQGLQDETRAQRQGDFTDNFNTFYFCDLLIASTHTHTHGSPEICVPLQLAGDSGTKIGKRTALLGCKI
jgi:hypothetical protein